LVNNFLIREFSPALYFYNGKDIFLCCTGSEYLMFFHPLIVSPRRESYFGAVKKDFFKSPGMGVFSIILTIFKIIKIH